MKRTILTAIALSAFVFAACGSKDKDKEEPAADETADQAAKPTDGEETKPAEPAGDDTAAEDLVQGSVNMMNGLTAALTENKDDCAAAGEAMKKVIEEHKDLIAKGQEMGASDPEMAQKMAENEEIKAAQAEWTKAMQENCAGDPAVMEALATMAPKPAAGEPAPAGDETQE